MVIEAASVSGRRLHVEGVRISCRVEVPESRTSCRGRRSNELLRQNTLGVFQQRLRLRPAHVMKTTDRTAWLSEVK